MNKNKTITVMCSNEDCQKPYLVQYSKQPAVMMMNVELALCPVCHQPNTNNFYRRDVKLCFSCGFYKYLWAFQVKWKRPNSQKKRKAKWLRGIFNYQICSSCRSRAIGKTM